MSEPNHRCVSDRLYTFLHYPDDAICWPSQLSRMGFYSTGQGEEVRCSGCGESHTSFQSRQSIRGEHIQRSPNCPLNVIGDDLQSDDASAAPYFVPIQQDVPIHLPREDLPVENADLIRYYSGALRADIVFNRSHPKKVDFELLDVEGCRLRRCTFHDWPEQNADWEQLALRGLFYTGTEDTVRCCVCGAKYKARLLRDHPRARRDSCPFPSCWTYVF